jgi:hypothetical protein
LFIEDISISSRKNDVFMGMSTTAGYDGQGDWNDWNVYQNYVNANGGMAQVCTYSSY